MPLSELLVKSGVMRPEQLSTALLSHPDPEDSLDAILIKRSLVERSTLISMLQDHYQRRYVALPEKVDVQVLKLIPEHLVEAYKCIPLSFDADSLTVAMVNPGDVVAIDRLAASTGYAIAPVGMLEGEFREFFRRYYEDTTMTQILKEIELSQDLAPTDAQTPEEEGRARPMIKLIDTMLALAVKKRASDIHIEPQKDFALVRLRVDGILQTQQVVPRAMLASMTARLKVLAELDITEKRAPQDGKFVYTLPDREIDVRLACLPSRYGEKLAMRLLDRRNFLINFDLLGLPAHVQGALERAMSRPNGLILVTGPTGSGKTTTLYAVVQKLRSPSLNIMTLEDPIEYELLAGSKREGGITQVQVNPKTGLTFAAGLRACLRQDPDVLFVGEMRDHETAETAISSALTGHLVLSSLHTNGALQTVARLLDMGVEPFLIVSAVRAIVAQKLVRVLCHQCKKPYVPPAEALKRLGFSSAEAGAFYKPEGCPACLQQGYLGRTGVFEIVTLDNELNKLIVERRPHQEIVARARAMGLKTLREHGMQLVGEGVTTIEEVLRVLPSL